MLPYPRSQRLSRKGSKNIPKPTTRMRAQVCSSVQQRFSRKGSEKKIPKPSSSRVCLCAAALVPKGSGNNPTVKPMGALRVYLCSSVCPERIRIFPKPLSPRVCLCVEAIIPKRSGNKSITSSPCVCVCRAAFVPKGSGNISKSSSTGVCVCAAAFVPKGSGIPRNRQALACANVQQRLSRKGPEIIR